MGQKRGEGATERRGESKLMNVPSPSMKCAHLKLARGNGPVQVHESLEGVAAGALAYDGRRPLVHGAKGPALAGP